MAYQFQPHAAITNDMLSNYSTYTDTIIRGTAFANSASLGRSSRTVYSLLWLGTILSTISFVTGFIAIKHGWLQFVSASTAVIASISVLGGLVIWTVLIKRAGDVNSWTVQPAQFPLGIRVSTGAGLPYGWIVFSFLVMSVIFHTVNLMLWSDGPLYTPRVPRWVDPSREWGPDRPEEDRPVQLDVRPGRGQF